jgi:RNase H-fold protein (predicted Holliday junction resolvase)
MRTAGADSRKQRGVIDKVAAALFLQAYLESRRP